MLKDSSVDNGIDFNGYFDAMQLGMPQQPMVMKWELLEKVLVDDGQWNSQHFRPCKWMDGMESMMM